MPNLLWSETPFLKTSLFDTSFSPRLRISCRFLNLIFLIILSKIIVTCVACAAVPPTLFPSSNFTKLWTARLFNNNFLWLTWWLLYLILYFYFFYIFLYHNCIRKYALSLYSYCTIPKHALHEKCYYVLCFKGTWSLKHEAKDTSRISGPLTLPGPTSWLLHLTF